MMTRRLSIHLALVERMDNSWDKPDKLSEALSIDDNTHYSAYLTDRIACGWKSLLVEQCSVLVCRWEYFQFRAYY